MASRPMSAIVAADLTRRFGDFTAVNKVSLHIAKGEVFGFLGPNGSGKTTLIRILTGILPATSGRGWVDGIDVGADPEGVRQRIGYMSQKFSVYQDLTVLENLRFYGRVYGLDRKKLQTKIDETLHRNALEPFAAHSAASLSGGWKQRLALSCAMLHEPTILFLDEPTAGIDPVARRAMWDLLFDLSANGVTCFVTTHYMDEAERCNHLAYIYYGKLIADGTPDCLRSSPDVRPAGTHRFEVRTNDPTTALPKVRELACVRTATVLGHRIRVLAEDRISMSDFGLELRRIGVGVEEIKPLLPDLEDVFVALTDRHQRQTRGPNA